jgi:hypothetical protein
MTIAMAKARTDSSNVAGKRPKTSAKPGCFKVIEVPKSPFNTPAPQMKNCCKIDLSKP